MQQEPYAHKDLALLVSCVINMFAFDDSHDFIYVPNFHAFIDLQKWHDFLF